EVRVNVPEAAGSANGGPGSGGGYRGGEGPGGGARYFPDDPAVQPFPSQPELVNVLIQGTIYIFNKPNPAVLQAPCDQQPATPPSAMNDRPRQYFTQRRNFLVSECLIASA